MKDEAKRGGGEGAEKDAEGDLGNMEFRLQSASLVSWAFEYFVVLWIEDFTAKARRALRDAEKRRFSEAGGRSFGGNGEAKRGGGEGA